MNTSTDYFAWDNTESVTYTVYGQTVANIGYTQPYTISKAKRRNISNADVPTQKTGIFTADDLVWLLPSALVPSEVRPNPNDYITDSDNKIWTVLDTQLNNLKSTWRLNCRDLILAEKLSNVIKISRPNNVKDSAGGRVTEYSNFMVNIPARIQEVGTETGDNFGKKAIVTRYEIYCGLKVNWKATDRVVDELENIYQIISGSAPDVMDTLQMLTCQKVL